MKKQITNLKFFLGVFLLVVSNLSGAQTLTDTKADVLAIIQKVNNYWQANTSYNQSSFWDKAAYHTGNIEAYQVTGIDAYRTYSENWAKYNNWIGATGTNKRWWKYSYGEGGDYVLFGDNQICFQTYIDLYNIDIAKNLTPDPTKIARAKEVMGYQITTSNLDYWWWIDGLYMVMPVMTKMYKLTGNEQYLEKLYQYFNYADGLMYDAEEQIYYRDASYVYPAHTTLSGKKDFWARGNGWAFAAFAKVLKDLPATNVHRPFFEERYKNMAKALIKVQQKEGYWARSLQDTAQAPGYETSGTAFFTYGLLWGINNGYLEKATYLPAAINGWNYLSKIALQANGRVGYVQPIGSAAVPGQIITASNTANFGVGAFLLAASELSRFLDVADGVENIQFNEAHFQLFPNPAVNSLKIIGDNVENYTITISDISGKMRSKVRANGSYIDISGLQKGIYLLQIQGEKLKLIKQ